MLFPQKSVVYSFLHNRRARRLNPPRLAQAELETKLEWVEDIRAKAFGHCRKGNLKALRPLLGVQEGLGPALMLKMSDRQENNAKEGATMLHMCVCVCIIAHNHAIRPCHPSRSMAFALVLIIPRYIKGSMMLITLTSDQT